MGGDRIRQLLDQGSEQRDLAGERFGGRPRLVGMARHVAFDRRKPPADFRDLAGKIGGAAGKIGDLVADIGAIARPAGDRIEERQAGQYGDRHYGGFNPCEPERQIEHGPDRAGDQNHTERDEDGTEAHHGRTSCTTRSPANRF